MCIWAWWWRVHRCNTYTYTCVSETGNDEARYVTIIPAYLSLAVKRRDRWHLYQYIWIWQWRDQIFDTCTCVSEFGSAETRHMTRIPVYLNLAVKRPDMWNLYLCIWAWRWRAPRPQSPWCVVHRFRPCGWWWWVHWATPGRGHRLCSLHALHTARGSLATTQRTTVQIVGLLTEHWGDPESLAATTMINYTSPPPPPAPLAVPLPLPLPAPPPPPPPPQGSRTCTTVFVNTLNRCDWTHTMFI